MKFEVGDDVVVKHTNEDGRVLEILDDKMVLVEVRGVRFPAHTDSLDFPYFKQFTKGKLFPKPQPAKKIIEQVKREKSPVKYSVSPGVWLLIFPVFDKDVFDEDIVENLKFYLVNQTDSGLQFHFWLYYQQEKEIEMTSEINALTDFYLLDISFEKMNDQPELVFEFSLMKHDASKLEYYEASYKPKARQVFKQIEALKEKGESFFTQLLFEKYPVKPPLEEESSPNALFDKFNQAGFVVKGNKKSFLKDAAPPSTIDLHIEKLTDKHGSLSGHEKLDLQLKEFDKWLGKIKMHYVKQAWVIHGVGGGRLRDEIHEILKHDADVKSYANHFHPWFGSGATEIFFN